MKLEEVYDVVDRDGNKIGEATWTPIHTKGLLHQVVHGLIFKDEKRREILLKKRSSIMHQGPELIEIAVAGHILSGYNPEKAIKKEIKEELLGGAAIPKEMKIRLVGRYFNNDLPNNHEIAHLFEIIYSGPFFESEESEEQAFWIDFNALASDMKKNPSKHAQFSINAIAEYSKITNLNA